MRTAACLLFLALAACDDPAPAGPVTPAPAPTAPPEAAPAPPAEPSPATTSGRRIGRGAPETAPDATALQQARAFREKLREGRQLSKAGRHVEAVAALRRAVELDPSNGPIRCELGWVAFLAGDQATAAEHIDAALVRLEQGGARTDAGRRSLAMCLYNRGRLAEAQNDAARALVLYRKSHRLRENRTVAARIAALESGAPPSAAPVPAATTERQCLVEGCGRVGPFPDVAALGDALEEAVGRSRPEIEDPESTVMAEVSG